MINFSAGKPFNFVEISSKLKNTTISFDEELLKKFTDYILSALGLRGWVLSICFVEDNEIQELNNTYRNIDKRTDVLSFPQVQFATPLTPVKPKILEKSSPNNILGDVIISVQTAKKNALRIGQTLAQEICFLITHSILHLCGHDHKKTEQEQTMLLFQKQLLSCFSQDYYTQIIKERN